VPQTFGLFTDRDRSAPSLFVRPVYLHRVYLHPLDPLGSGPLGRPCRRQRAL